MIELFRVAADVQGFCEEQGWRFCFIGGVAVQMWAELRTTKDVDLTLFTGFGTERGFIDLLLSRYALRRSLAGAAGAARRNVVAGFSP